MQLKEIADIIFTFPTRSQQQQINDKKWITGASLLVDNYMEEPQPDLNLIPDESLTVFDDDILIKRIRPQFVNYISESNGYLAGQNLAIVRAKGIDAKYLACIIEINIDKLYEKVTGAVLPSIKKADFESLDIGKIPPLDTQQQIGNLWWLQKERKKLQQELFEKETMFLKVSIKEKISK